jgi:uroporphyrinogen-III synthase
MELVIDQISQDKLNSTLDDYDFVFLISPTIIDYLRNAILAARKTNFIVPGVASKERLAQLTKLPIIAPVHSSGFEALKAEYLTTLMPTLANSRVLLVHGDELNKEVVEFFAMACKVHSAICLYQRQKKQHVPGYLSNILTTQSIDGIIVTSSLLVEWLVEEAKEDSCWELLRKLPFITIHKKIAHKLVEAHVCGAITVTDSSQYLALVDLICSKHLD